MLYQQKTTQDRILEITGHTTDIDEALDQWELEKQTLADLFDENQALVLSFRRYDVAMKIAERIIREVESDAAMFITSRTRDRIETFRQQMSLLENYRAADRELVAVTNERIYLRSIHENQAETDDDRQSANLPD